MMYVIYITDEKGNRIRVNGMFYKAYSDACEASKKMRMENPACEAAAVKVMCRK